MLYCLKSAIRSDTDCVIKPIELGACSDIS
jgi:hypothetical protein